MLRFTYLLDFLTMDRLAGVYMGSLREFLEKIRKVRLVVPEQRIRGDSEVSAKKQPELDQLILILARFVPDYLRKEKPRVVEVEVDGFDTGLHLEDFDLTFFAEFTDPPFQIEDHAPSTHTELINQKD